MSPRKSRTNLPKVSVVMAAYNSMSYIGPAIESVLSQTFSELELIIVDDGSHDGTADIVLEVQARDPRVRLVRNATNLGPGKTRNDGIRQARGEWIAILDSDDHFEPNRVELLLHEAEKHGAVLLADNQNMTIENTTKPFRLLRSWALDTPVWLGADDLLKGDQNGKSDNLGLLKPFVRKDFLDANQIWYDEEMGIGEDFYFLLACLKHATRLLFVTKPLYNYTIRRESLCSEPVLSKFVVLQFMHARHVSLFDPKLTPSTARLMAQRGRNISRYLRYQKIAIPLKRSEYFTSLRQALADPGAVPSVLFGIVKYVYHRITNVMASKS